MTGEGVAAPDAGDRALDDIGERAVVLNKIEVRRREVFQVIAEVADDGDGLEENLRQDDGGAEVEVDAAVIQLLDKGAEQAKILQRRLPQAGAVSVPVHVNNIGADGDVSSQRHTSLIGGT